MVNTIKLSSNSDIIGAVASTLCFLHCLATPLFFVAYAGTAIAEESQPWWWGTLDIIFLAISFFAVYWSARTTSKSWIKYALWISWLLLSLIVLNEKFELLHFSEEVIYVPTAALVLLHIYNHRYHGSENDECSVDKKAD